MNADRELLELAAKAAGITILRSRLEDPMWKDMLLADLAYSNGRAGWNPLMDDGDALRLAVTLRMRVHHDGSCATAELPTGQKYCWTEAAVVEGDEPCAATRRAIVRAAAALAEAKGA